jgi:hypothetical protein
MGDRHAGRNFHANAAAIDNERAGQRRRFAFGENHATLGIAAEGIAPFTQPMKADQGQPTVRRTQTLFAGLAES